jgi:carbon monoxide dehydrogenase subunit G
MIQIDATPQEVWDVATDLGRVGQWVSIHHDFPGAPPDALAQGSRFQQVLKVAGVKFRVEWTATRVDGPENLVWDGTGPAGTTAHTSYTLVAADGGTRFTYANEFTLPARKIGKAAARVVAGQAERQARDSLETLKRLVES